MPPAISTTQLSGLIGRIYDCAVDPGRWEGVLTEIYPLLNCANASLDLFEIPSSRLMLHIAVGIPAEYATQVTNYAADIIDMWGGWEQVARLPYDDVAVLTHVQSPDRLATSKYLAEWGEPQGLFDIMAIGVARDSLALGSLAMGRHRSAGAVTRDDLEVARLLIPHLQRAMNISRLLELRAVEYRTLEATLDAVAAGIVLVGPDLQIVHANRVADSMLKRRDPISSEHGALVLGNRTSEAALRQAVSLSGEDEALIGRRGQGIPIRTAAGDPGVLHVLPLKRGEARQSLGFWATAAIFIAPSGAMLAPPDRALSALFDLTPAESRVFVEAAKGATMAQIADALAVAPSTIKTHLRQIYRKTETRRQVDLMALANSLTLTL